MTAEQGRRQTIAESGDQELIERVRKHLGPDVLNWTLALAANYADGPYGQTDPRSRVGNITIGELGAKGGSGPKKEKAGKSGSG